MRLSAMNPMRDAVVRMEHMTVKDFNRQASQMGFKIDHDIFSCISFDNIDQLTRAIILSQDFETKTNLYFLSDVSQYSRIIYDSQTKLLFIIDLSEEAHLKKVKSDVVMSISHELRTPLSVALGNVQMLKDFSDFKDEESEKKIDKTMKSLKKLEKIISQLSLLTQAEFGNYSLRYEIFEPVKVIEEVVSDYQKKLDAKTIHVKIDCQAETIKADRFIIYTILRNLISNAIKYSHPDSTIVCTFTERLICVKDTGIGIREEERIRVFERFFRGTESFKHAQGSGLGLPLVKYLCEISGYKVWFESKWLIGSTFYVQLSKDVA